MEKKKLLQQCSEYFKNNQGFSRIMVKIRDRYKSLGKIGGTITLDKLTIAEKEALTGFLKNNYYKDSVCIKIKKFENALEDTPFAGISLIDVLNEYFGEEIITRQDEKSIYEKEKEDFFINIMNTVKDTKAYEWIKYVLESKKNAYNIVLQRYAIDSDSLSNDLYIVLDGINNLPYFKGERERLALFSSRISKNPHTFDENTECGRLLIYGVVYLLSEKYPQNAEERAEILYRAGIIKDEISNFTICSGLLAYTDGKIHKGWEGFYDENEPIQISLWNLSRIEKVITPNGKIFVFENPTVFSEVLYITANEKPALMCTYGQVKLASLILLDMLVKQNTKIYYSGDFDPEGLIIADKLKNRYNKSLILWRYNLDDYKKSVSDNRIDDNRLKKMDKLNNENLIILKECIMKHRRAGYQELLIDELIRDIKEV
ncbi:TIGR02679 family protein [Brassicibacter mesophilus]|uniref:TIGR02679 family protein n=1 Tax=Brassicibacter mesophilus TaxID=745119 RepID=UPI003D1EC65B